MNPKTDRTISMLHALADAPGGLSTAELFPVGAPDIAQDTGGGHRSRQQALRRCRFLLSEQVGRGRVRQAGTIPAPGSKAPMTVWQITDEGRRCLSLSPADRRKRPPARPLFPHKVPLDDGTSAWLELPADLTPGEADRLRKVIQSLARSSSDDAKA